MGRRIKVMSNAFNRKRIEKNLIEIAQNEYLSVLIMCLWKKENFGKERIWDFLYNIKKFDNSYAAGAENIKQINAVIEDQFGFQVFFSGVGKTRNEILKISALKAYTMISCLILNDVYDWSDSKIKGFITHFKNSVAEYSDYQENKELIFKQFGFKIG
jgi:hypothetical protein